MPAVPVGRKPFYTDGDELADACRDYFLWCDVGETVEVIRRGKAVPVKKAIPYTVPGLALYLGYANRSAIWDLKQKPAFRATILRALSQIEQQRVSKALLGEQESRFAQFDLINNCGYTSSKQEVNVNAQITYSDDELAARIASIESRTDAIEQRPDVTVIDGDFAPKLLK